MVRTHEASTVELNEMVSLATELEEILSLDTSFLVYPHVRV
jgi:hypothetical protein